MKLRILNIVLFLCVFLQINSQNPSNIKNFSIEDGLTQNSISCIFQSSDGIIWIGTQDGLNAYDGYGFTHFKYNSEDENSLSSNYIYDIDEDDNGNLLIATKHGLTIWNRNQNEFYRLQHNPQNSNSISANSVFQVFVFNQTIWALNESSLEKYVGDGNFEHFYFHPDTNVNRYNYNFYDLVSDSDGNIWLASKDGAYIFNTKSENFFHIHDAGSNRLSNKRVRAFFSDKKEDIWIGTQNGLNLFTKNSQKLTSYYYENKEELTKENTITDILIDKNNNFWIATKKGIKTFKNEKIINFKNSKLSSIADYVTCIIQDLSGNIWYGTIGGGLYEIIMKEPKFKGFSDFPENIDKSFFGLYVDDDRIWTGSNGLTVIDKKTKKVLFFDDLNFSDSVADIMVYKITEINGKIWLGTTNNIFIVDKETYEITDFYNFFNVTNSIILTDKRITDIKKDKEGNVWLASFSGLIKYNNGEFKVYLISDYFDNEKNRDIVIKILLDKEKIWITTHNGLYMFDKKEETFNCWTSEDGLPNSFVLDIEKVADSILWISTASGLSKMNIKTKTFTNYTAISEGFINDLFYDIIREKDNLWLNSNYGVVKFNFKNLTHETYDKKNGLFDLEGNLGAVFIDNDNVYFGNLNGLNWCNYSDVSNLLPAPKVVFTKIEKFGFETNKEIFYFPDTNKIYEFSHKDIINIYFSIPEYSFPENNKYKYKIIGFSEDWYDVQKRNFISLTGIAPGTYTIWIKGANSDNVWSKEITKITIHIKPPFSESRIAILFYILLLVFVLLTVTVIVFKNNKRKTIIIQEKNKALKQVDFQRELLENKTKDITDSINYAKKIIDAILPKKRELKLLIPENFIFFEPKDIVSGDFYWFAEKNDHIYIAAVDCTGHGIPGAFMSIIGINLLENIIDEGIVDPAIFLNIMNKEIINTLKKDMDKSYLKDGMDMTMCIIDKRRKQLKYAGAYNPAYIIRDGIIIQLKGDRKSVGNNFDLDPFTPFSMKIREDDVIYVFTDGYTDQFSEKNRKKFKFKRFRLLLLSIYKLPMKEQQEKLKEAFFDWKGKTEQIDDVLVIGFKPFLFEFKNK